MMTSEALELVSPPIAVTKEQWAILAGILGRYAGGRPVWAYGSRARAGATKDVIKPYSDPDLVVGGEPFRGLEEWALKEALDESLLPFRVEFQHESGIKEEFVVESTRIS